MAELEVSRQLESYTRRQNKSTRQIRKFASSSPLLRMKDFYRKEIAEQEVYRTTVLKSVSVFSTLSHENIITAAQSLDSLDLQYGHVVIEQDDMGDAFFIIESGEVVVTRKSDHLNEKEVPQELGRLGVNRYFGEMSLLTREPRSATVTVCSPTARLLRMTKAVFDEVIAKCNSVNEKNNREIGREVVNKVPLFQTLTAAYRQKILDMMVPMNFVPGTYVCRQGTVGNTFYIIIDGTCKVSVNGADGKENEVAKLGRGDFFGEMALIDVSGKRAANVFAVNNVSCMTLSRTEFTNLLATLRSALVDFPNRAKRNTTRGINFIKRRVTTIDDANMRSPALIPGFVHKMCRFLMDGMWCSLYFRLYRDLVIHLEHNEKYGEIIAQIALTASGRTQGVQMVMDKIMDVGRGDPNRRIPGEHKMVYGLLAQSEMFKEKICKEWPDFQIYSLCQTAKIARYRSFSKICEAGAHGTTFFLIIRGAARVYTHHILEEDGKTVLKYEEDLIPGDIFGETVLDGLYTRFATVQAMTTCDVAMFELSDYSAAQDRSVMKAAVDDRFKFLVKTPIFRNWGRYDLYRVAPLMKKIEVNKGAILFRRGDVTDQLSFLMEGRIDIVNGLEGAARNDIIVSIQKYEYYGESGILSHFKPDKNQKVFKEYCYAVAGAFSEILVLNPDQYQIIDRETVIKMLDVFRAKKHWRADRSVDMKSEKLRLKKIKKELSIIQSQTVYDSIFGGNVNEVPGIVTQMKASKRGGDSFISPHDIFMDENGNEKLPDLNDIPKIVDSDLDPLLVTSTCRNERSLKYARALIDTARKPAIRSLQDQDLANENIGIFVMSQIHSARSRSREGARPERSIATSYSERAALRQAARRTLGAITSSRPNTASSIIPDRPPRYENSTAFSRPVSPMSAGSSPDFSDDEGGIIDSDDDGDDVMATRARAARNTKAVLRGCARIPNAKSYCDTMSQADLRRQSSTGQPEQHRVKSAGINRKKSIVPVIDLSKF